MADANEWIKKLEIIPDVIENTTNSVELKIKFPVGEVKEGNIFKPPETKNQPTVSWTANSDELYTLINVDPDAPNRKEAKYREWRHWVVVNIPGNDLTKGDVVSSYMGAGPPKGSGLHRYVFLLFKQNNHIQVEKFNDMGMGRASFRIREFASKYNLGEPVAVSAYQAQNE
eukprot:TRINITY_DN4100_c0_g2_i1.p1 TRINITY_DN4100_c0_g2~~TRINITY_DN4100_c0_g2_i1.p1  ORF type:complete len:171 (+),score=34.09 TRINITY_DN4100_c0_g2_i1:197-709(+)